MARASLWTWSCSLAVLLPCYRILVRLALLVVLGTSWVGVFYFGSYPLRRCRRPRVHACCILVSRVHVVAMVSIVHPWAIALQIHGLLPPLLPPVPVWRLRCCVGCVRPLAWSVGPFVCLAGCVVCLCGVSAGVLLPLVSPSPPSAPALSHPLDCSDLVTMRTGFEAAVHKQSVGNARRIASNASWSLLALKQ